MLSKNKGDQFSPHSSSPSHSIHEEDELNTNEVVDFIDTYEEKQSSPYHEHESDIKEEAPENRHLIPESEPTLNKTNPLKRKNSNKSLEGEVESNESGALKKFRAEFDSKSLSRSIKKLSPKKSKEPSPEKQQNLMEISPKSNKDKKIEIPNNENQKVAEAEELSPYLQKENQNSLEDSQDDNSPKSFKEKDITANQIQNTYLQQNSIKNALLDSTSPQKSISIPNTQQKTIQNLPSNTEENLGLRNNKEEFLKKLTLSSQIQQSDMVIEHQDVSNTIDDKEDHCSESNDDDSFDPEKVIRKKKTLKEDFEPGSYECENLISETDIEIVRLDIPERLQGRFRIKEETTSEALLEEAKWIGDRFKKRGNPFPNDKLIKKIQKSLSFLKVSHFEVPFLFFYRKNDLFPEIQFAELWEIYDLDEEWEKVCALKKCIKANMKLLTEYMEPSKLALDFSEKTMDLSSLTLIHDYAVFHLSKFLEGENAQKISFPETSKEVLPKKSTKRVFAYDAIQFKLDDFARKAGLSSEELAENLLNDSKKKGPLKTPTLVNFTPEEVALEFTIPGKTLVNSTLDTLNNVCRYMASELFNDPNIKHHLKTIYFEKVTICTEATLQGNKELDIFHRYYIVKRINRRPMKEFQDDLWLKMLKSEKEGLIKIRVVLPWEEDLKMTDKFYSERKDEIFNLLLKLYVSPLSQRSDYENKLIAQWNVFRGEVLRILLNDLAYPCFEKLLKDELTEISENFVVNYCSKKLKEMANTAPYLVPLEHSISYGKIQKFIKPKIVSVVPESNNQQQGSGKISFVAVDSDGIFIEYLPLKFFAIQSLDAQIPSVKTAYEKDYSEFEKFMLKHQPDLVIVSTNCLDSRRIRQIMLNFKEDYMKNPGIEENKRFEDPESMRPNNSFSEGLLEHESVSYDHSNSFARNQPKPSTRKEFNVIYGENTVPSLFAKTLQAEIEFKGSPLSLKEGVSLARFAQNPLAEVLNLWSEKNNHNALFYIPFHPLQNQVTLSRLRKEFDKVIMETVSSVGIDFNEAIKFQHLSSGLQFISGLGPKKVINLIEMLKNKNKNGFKGLKARSQMLTEKLMEKKVFTNCAGFLKIQPLLEKALDFENEKHIETLDITRIHPDNYSLAKKIAKDALDEDAGVNPQEHIPKIMRNSFKLQELDLEDYANHMAALKSKPNMIYVLNFIVEELVFPFRDPRHIPFIYSAKDIFYKLSKLTPENFRVNSFVDAKISRVMKSNLLCELENGLVGTVFYLDIFEQKQAANDNLSQFFEEGSKIKAKIKSIDYEKFKIELNMRPSELKPHRNMLNDLFPGYWENISKHFKIREEDDFPLIQECKKITLKYQPRSVNHEKFKNISYATAIEHLLNKPIGDFIIRPSNNKSDNLIISWKFYEKIFVHLDFKENSKASLVFSAPRFSMGKELFDTLDEVLERTIFRCNNLMKTVIDHPKFHKDDLHTIERALYAEKEKNSSITPYFFGCSDQAPQFLVLIYLMSSGEIIREFIKVKPEGLFFHNSYFTSLKQLITFFKENQKTEEYQHYLHKTKPPFCDIDDNTGQYNDQNIDDEPAVIFEGTSNNATNNNEKEFQTAAQQYQRQDKEENSRNNTRDYGRDNNRERPRPQCTFCDKLGHTEEKCFKKYPKNNSSFEERPSTDFAMSWNAPKTDNRKSNVNESVTWGGADDVGITKPTTEGVQWGESNKPNEQSEGMPAWGNESIEQKPQSSTAWGDESSNLQTKRATSWGNENESENKGWGSSGFGGGGFEPSGENRGSRNNNDRGGKRGCFNCGEDGHMSKDCPQPRKERGGGGGGGGSRKCYKCNEEGHMAKDCTNEGAANQNRSSQTCRICNKEGHFAKDCPDKRGGGGGSNACFNCGKEGHRKQDCPEPLKPRVPKCFNCNEEGHLSKDCQQEKKPFCHNCKEPGHWKRDCTKERQDEGGNNGGGWSGGANNKGNGGDWSDRNNNKSGLCGGNDNNNVSFGGNEGKNWNNSNHDENQDNGRGRGGFRGGRGGNRGGFNQGGRNYENEDNGGGFDRSRSRENERRNDRGRGDRGRGRGRGRGGHNYENSETSTYGGNGGGGEAWGSNSNGNNQKNDDEGGSSWANMQQPSSGDNIGWN